MDFYVDKVTRVRGVSIFRLVSLKDSSVIRATLDDLHRLKDSARLGVKTALGLCPITYRQLPHLKRLCRGSQLLRDRLPQICRPIIDQNLRSQLTNDDSVLLFEVSTAEGNTYLALGMTLSGTIFSFLTTKKDFRGSYVLITPDRRIIFRHRLEQHRQFPGEITETYNYKKFIDQTLLLLPPN